MKLSSLAAIAVALFAYVALLPGQARAHGKVTCNSGPIAEWKSMDALKAKITAQGWTIRKAHPYKDCYEVYGTTPEGDKVEAFFHPVTLERVLVLRRGEVLYKAP